MNMVNNYDKIIKTVPNSMLETENGSNIWLTTTTTHLDMLHLVKGLK